MKDTLSSDDISDGETAVQEGLDWLSANEDASTEVFKEKQARMEDRIKPIMVKLYGSSSSAGGMPPGFNPSSAAEASGSTPGPTPGPKVEEVD